MRVVIAGGHGKIALRLARLLEDRGEEVVSLIRDPGHISEVQATGADAVVCDLERADVAEVVGILRAADAVVFAAGAGPGSGAERKDTVDRGAAVLMAVAAEQAGVRRLIQISSIGAGEPPDPARGEVWAAYIAAKTSAEEDLRSRDLDWTILRPGGLLDRPGTGRVRLAEPPVERGEVSRDDVAAVIAELLGSRAGVQQTLVLVGGDTPAAEAVRTLVSSR